MSTTKQTVRHFFAAHGSIAALEMYENSIRMFDNDRMFEEYFVGSWFLRGIVRTWRGIKDLETLFRIGHYMNLSAIAKEQRDCVPEGTYDRYFTRAVERCLCLRGDEVKKMRKFGAMFESFEDFRKQYPHVQSWARIKAEVLSA